MGAGASIQIDEKTSNMLKEETMKPMDASDVATPRGESAKAEVIRLRALIAQNADKSNESFNTTSSRLVPETYLSAETFFLFTLFDCFEAIGNFFQDFKNVDRPTLPLKKW